MADAARLNSMTGNIILPRGLMYFPSLFKPYLSKKEKDPSKAKYQCSILFPANADISVLEQAVRDVLDENIPPKKQATTKFRWPLLATKDQPKLLDYVDDYPVLIRCTSKNRPDVVSANGQRTLEEKEEPDEVYSGRWCRLAVRPFWYPVGDSPIPGVSIGLQNVMLAFDNAGDPGDAIAGGRVRGVSDFEGVADGLEDLE